MNGSILNSEVQSYIDHHLNVDLNKLRLGKSPFPDVSSLELAQQIESKKLSQKKLPTLFQTPFVYYPPKLAIEQSSSELTAAFKAALVGSGPLLDLTGGIGIDSLFFSKQADTVTHCEINPELSLIAAHNHKVLGAANISHVDTNGLDYLRVTEEHFETIYIDPSRRKDQQKVFLFKDCEPDVVANLDLLLDYCDVLFIKSAPMMDITAGMRELGLGHSSNSEPQGEYTTPLSPSRRGQGEDSPLSSTSAGQHTTPLSPSRRGQGEDTPHHPPPHIFVVSLKNECKELLWKITANRQAEPEITCVKLNTGSLPQKYTFHPSDERNFEVDDYSLPLSILYEPDASLLKAGCFKIITRDFKVIKLNQHTHLYTAETDNPDFIGRRFQIQSTIPYSDFLKNPTVSKANISCRNFPLRPDELKRKLKIEDGGDIYLFFCKGPKEELIVVKTTKITGS